jgi:hypothetical protein
MLVVDKTLIAVAAFGVASRADCDDVYPVRVEHSSRCLSPQPDTGTDTAPAIGGISRSSTTLAVAVVVMRAQVLLVTKQRVQMPYPRYQPQHHIRRERRNVLGVDAIDAISD